MLPFVYNVHTKFKVVYDSHLSLKVQYLVFQQKKMLRSPPVKKFQKPCRVFSSRRGLVAGVDRDLFYINICTFKLLSLSAAEEK